jgi:hypothetical protein
MEDLLMRFTRTACTSALTVALALSAAPALAADPPGTPIGAGPDISKLLQDRQKWLLHGPMPECPAGERPVWISRPGKPPKLYIDHLGRMVWTKGELPYEGWECAPLTLAPVGP